MNYSDILQLLPRLVAYNIFKIKWGMFHLQKSSKSSDQNRQVNLLHEEDRISKVNIVRADTLKRLRSKNPYDPSNPISPSKPHKMRKGSLDLKYEYRESAASENDNADYNYSQMGVPEAPRPSVSILTDVSTNNKLIGVILFGILILFTPLQGLAFIFSTSGSIKPQKQSASKMSSETALELLLFSELASFSILFYLKWIERMNIYKQIYRSYRRHKKNTHKSHILNNPFFLSFLILAITIIYSLFYAQTVLSSTTTPSLIVLMVTLLPQISISLLYEDELHDSIIAKTGYYLGNVWILACVLVMFDYYVVITCCMSMLLIYLSLRMGREIMYLEYMIGRIPLIIVVLLIDFFTTSEDEKTDKNHPPIILGFLILTFSIVVVRCVNNKILRNQLYKYFYNDAIINCVLLCLPLVMGWLEGQFNYLLAIGCFILMLTCYKVSRDKSYVTMGFN